MNNKVKLSQTFGIIIVAILLALATAKVPMLGILGLLVSVPYALISILSNTKNSILSIIVTFLVLMVFVDPIYATNICILNAIPGLVIGSIARKNLAEDEYNKFEPIYGGTVIFVVSSIIFFFVMKFVFKTNVLEEFMGIIIDNIKMQMDAMKGTDIDIFNGLRVEDVANYINNMLPTLLFFQGMISAFITYCVTVFVLRKTKKSSIQKPKFTDFYLPGNAVATSFVLYLTVLFVEIIGLNLHTELIMVNLQLVFSFMFMAQGIAVSIFFVKKWMRQGSGKMILLGGLVMCITGVMGISFVGMLDSIIDFRRVRSYKST